MSPIQAQSNDLLYLDSENSLVLPYFDTTSIANSNIENIVLSLYVIEKTPVTLNSVQITINSLDLNTNKITDGLSTFADIDSQKYIDFVLPKELFKETIGSPKRFLVRLVDKNQSLILQGADSQGLGTAHDPMLVVVQGPEENKTPDVSPIIEYKFYNILDSQVHFGAGDNVAQNKIEKDQEKSADIPQWLKYLVAVATIIGIIWGIISFFLPQDHALKQVHYGNGDNVAGDKNTD